MASRTCWSCGVVANITPISESGTRREPVEPAVGHAIFTNLMACFRCDGCGALSIRNMWTGDIVKPDLDAAGIAAMLMLESPFPEAGGGRGGKGWGGEGGGGRRGGGRGGGGGKRGGRGEGGGGGGEGGGEGGGPKPVYPVETHGGACPTRIPAQIAGRPRRLGQVAWPWRPTECGAPGQAGIEAMAADTGMTAGTLVT